MLTTNHHLHFCVTSESSSNGVHMQLIMVKVKVKQFRYRFGVAERVLGS